MATLWQLVAQDGTGVLAPKEEMLHSSKLGGSNGFQGSEVSQPVATLWHGSPAPKEEMLQSSKLGGSNIRVLEDRGLAGLAGLARLARLAGLAGVAGRRIGTT